MNTYQVEKTIATSMMISGGLERGLERTQTSSIPRDQYRIYPSDFLGKEMSKEDKMAQKKAEQMMSEIGKKESGNLHHQELVKTIGRSQTLVDMVKSGEMSKVRQLSMKDEDVCQTVHSNGRREVQKRKSSERMMRRDPTHLLKEVQQRRMTSSTSSKANVNQMRNNIEERIRTLNIEYQTDEDKQFIISFFSTNFKVRKVNTKSSTIMIVLEDESIAEFIVSHGGISNGDKVYTTSGYHWDGSKHAVLPPNPIPVTSSSMRELIEKDKLLSQPGFLQRTLQNITTLFQPKQSVDVQQ